MKKRRIIQQNKRHALQEKRRIFCNFLATVYSSFFWQNKPRGLNQHSANSFRRGMFKLIQACQKLKSRKAEVEKLVETNHKAFMLFIV